LSLKTRDIDDFCLLVAAAAAAAAAAATEHFSDVYAIRFCSASKTDSVTKFSDSPPDLQIIYLSLLHYNLFEDTGMGDVSCY